LLSVLVVLIDYGFTSPPDPAETEFRVSISQRGEPISADIAHLAPLHRVDRNRG
jgi:hypothetical protein